MFDQEPDGVLGFWGFGVLELEFDKYFKNLFFKKLKNFIFYLKKKFIFF